MKKLFAGIVAALALIPVVAKAASYEVGEYVNFAGSESDWAAFHAAGTPEEIEEYLEKTGVGSLYIADSTHTGYLKVLSLVANVTLSNGAYATAGQELTAGALFADVQNENRKEAVSPYGYATSATTGIDVSVASLADITALFGVSNVGDKVTLTDKNKTIFELITKEADGNKVYIFTADETSTADTYYALEVTKTAGEVTSVELVTHTAIGTFNAALFSVIEMNKAYVCTDAPEDSYACYECTTTDNQTEFQWRVEGTQKDTCKKSTKITSKAKCVKSPKTGVDSYLVPSAIVLGVCAIVLTVVKRKDAFKAI